MRGRRGASYRDGTVPKVSAILAGGTALAAAGLGAAAMNADG